MNERSGIKSGSWALRTISVKLGIYFRFLEISMPFQISVTRKKGRLHWRPRFSSCHLWLWSLCWEQFSCLPRLWLGSHFRRILSSERSKLQFIGCHLHSTTLVLVLQMTNYAVGIRFSSTRLPSWILVAWYSYLSILSLLLKIRLIPLALKRFDMLFQHWYRHLLPAVLREVH